MNNQSMSDRHSFTENKPDCYSPRARGHLIAKLEHSSDVYHLKEHRLGFQKMKLLSVYVGG